jgi:hypothetical protein
LIARRDRVVAKKRKPAKKENPPWGGQRGTIFTRFSSNASKASPEAAKVGLASLMWPEGPLPDVPFAEWPLRRGPNDAAAIIAAVLARWRHVLSCLVLPRVARDPESNMRVAPFTNAVNPYSVAALDDAPKIDLPAVIGTREPLREDS